VGDLARPGFIQKALSAIAPDVLIHCAAMVNVDECEKNPSLAYAANAEITRVLARSVPSYCLFVYIGTDSIFKGDLPFATEARLPCPRTVYSRSKLHGEWEVELAGQNHLIIRTNFYGWSSGRNRSFGEWLYHTLKNGQPCTLFSDLFFTPIYVVDLVKQLELLIHGGYQGLIHLSGRDRVSKHEFGIMMARAAGFSINNVRPGSIEEAPLLAPRPKDMSLSSGRFRQLTGVVAPVCLSGLRRFLSDQDRPIMARVNNSQESSRSVGDL
jgi:dTDP-4-dehydrorhamnose reductase